MELRSIETFTASMEKESIRFWAKSFHSILMNGSINIWEAKKQTKTNNKHGNLNPSPSKLSLLHILQHFVFWLRAGIVCFLLLLLEVSGVVFWKLVKKERETPATQKWVLTDAKAVKKHWQRLSSFFFVTLLFFIHRPDTNTGFLIMMKIFLSSGIHHPRWPFLSWASGIITFF